MPRPAFTSVSSSGDQGSNAEGVAGNVMWPTSHGNVIAVGGTSIASGTEESWYGSSGGGYSIYYAKTGWQTETPIRINPAGLQARCVPDVAAVADPYQLVIQGGTHSAGGTSCASPMWAALIALLTAKRGRPLPFLPPQLYALRDQFTDIVTGNNGAYNAGPGYDLVTGLGVPNADLISALEALP